MLTGNLSPLLLAGVFYLVITVPLTHLVNYIDARMRVGKRITGVQSGLKEVAELAEAGVPGAAKSPAAAPTRFKGGSIEVKNIDMAYGAVQVLHDVSLKVEPGTVTCLIGPSGSGKSTLLRCLNRLVECRAGDILLDGESIYKPDP